MKNLIKYGLLTIVLLIMSGCNLSTPKSNEVKIGEDSYSLTFFTDAVKNTNLYTSVADSIFWTYVDWYIDDNNITHKGYEEYYAITPEDIESKELSDEELKYLKENYKYQKAINELFSKVVKKDKVNIDEMITDSDKENIILLQGILTKDTSKLSEEERQELIKEFEASVIAKGNEIKKKYDNKELLDVDMEIEHGKLDIMVVTPKEIKTTHEHGKDLKVGEHVLVDDVLVDVLYKVGQVDINLETVKENVLVEYIEETYPDTLDILNALEQLDNNFVIGYNVQQHLSKELADKKKEEDEKIKEMFEIDAEQLPKNIDK